MRYKFGEEKWGPYLFPVGSDQREDKASVHDRQQIIEEEGQAGVQSLHQLQVLVKEKTFVWKSSSQDKMAL